MMIINLLAIYKFTWCLLVASYASAIDNLSPIKDGAMGSGGLKHLVPRCWWGKLRESKV